MIAEQFSARTSDRAAFDPHQHGYTITVNATADVTGEALRSCLLATEPDGVCVNTSLHFADPQMPMLHVLLNSLTLTGGLSHARPNMPSVLALIAGGRISPGLVATDVLPFDTAAEAIADAGFKPVFVRAPTLAPPEHLGGAST